MRKNLPHCDLPVALDFQPPEEAKYDSANDKLRTHYVEESASWSLRDGVNSVQEGDGHRPKPQRTVDFVKTWRGRKSSIATSPTQSSAFGD